MHPRLPPELFENILCHITSASDLRGFLLASHVCSREAERFLYRDITIDEDRFSASLSNTLRIPRLAHVVRRLEVTANPLKPYSKGVDGMCLHSLHSILGDLVCLQHLIINGGLSYTFGSGFQYLLEHATSSLESLSFSGIIIDDHIPLIEKQTQLRELIIHQRPVTWNLSAFPRLVIVGCSGDTAAKCLADGTLKVSRLQWTVGFPDHHQPPFHGIRSLDIFLFTTGMKVLAKIITNFPNLEYLKCTYLAETMTLHKKFENDANEISSLNLPSLCKIYLHIITEISGPPEAWDKYQPLFSCIPSLQIVQLQFQREPMSRRWLQQDPTSWTMVPSQPDEWKCFELSKNVQREPRGIGFANNRHA